MKPTDGAWCAAPENPVEHLGRDGLREEIRTDIAPFVDRAVHTAAFVLRKATVLFHLKSARRTRSKRGALIGPRRAAIVQFLSPVQRSPAKGRFRLA
jgi:hypothetical protein